MQLFSDHQNVVCTLADISAALFCSAKCCVKAALVAPLATPANYEHGMKQKEAEVFREQPPTGTSKMSLGEYDLKTQSPHA